MSAYIIAQIDIHDPVEYEQYAQGARPLFPGYRCEVLVADGSPTLLEGTWPYNKTVVIRFEDEAEAQRWYRSPEYQAIVKFRLNSSSTNLVLTKGIR